LRGGINSGSESSRKAAFPNLGSSWMKNSDIHPSSARLTGGHFTVIGPDYVRVLASMMGHQPWYCSAYAKEGLEVQGGGAGLLVQWLVIGVV